MVLTDERDLGRAIKQKEEKLEIRGTLKDRVCRIRSVEERQWKACVSQIGMAVGYDESGWNPNVGQCFDGNTSS